MSNPSDTPNTQGDPDLNADADTASGGAPEEPDTALSADDDTTDAQSRPVENPSG